MYTADHPGIEINGESRSWADGRYPSGPIPMTSGEKGADPAIQVTIPPSIYWESGMNVGRRLYPATLAR